MDTKSIKYLSILIAFLSVFGLTTSAFAVCDVTESADDVNTVGTLRNCIEMQGDATINILTNIVLDSTIVISSDFSISTDGAGPFTIDGQGGTRLFNTENVDANYQISFADVILTGGNGAEGAAIRVGNDHDLELDCVTVTGNTSTGNGGGVRSEGTSTLMITDSTFSMNHSDNSGGGVSAVGSSLTIENSTFNNNDADDNGGAINVGGPTIASITNSTICNNQTNGFGGGIHTNNDIDLIHVTIASNTANFDEDATGEGGGIATNNTGDVVNAVNTFLFNNIMVPNGGGVSVQNCGSENTFDADNNGFSLSNDATCEDITTMAIAGVLGLADNGGKTQTKQVLSSSNIFETATADCTSTDQRGEPRTPGAGPCTPGAYEPGLEVGSIEVVKSVAGSIQDFTFNITSNVVNVPADTACTPNLAGGNVNLGDTDTTNCTNLPIGTTYTILETIPAGFQLDTINCVPTGAPTINVDLANNRVLVTLENDGDRAVCTFTNSEVPTQDLTVNVTDASATGCSFDSTPAGILDCVAGGGTCMAPFNEGEMVTVNETVGGITFTCGGGCDANCMVTIPAGMAPAACDIECTEVTPTQDLTVVVSDPENTGCSFDSNPSGISNCTDAGGTCTAPFAEGSNVTIDDALIGLEFDCSGSCNSSCVASIPNDGMAPEACNILCTEIPSGDGGGTDGDDDDDSGGNIVAINSNFTLFGPSQSGPFGDETTQELVFTGQATGTTNSNNLNNLTIDIFEDDGLDITNVIIEPNIGSCAQVVQEDDLVVAKEVLSFICTIPFLADGATFDLIIDVFIDARNEPNLENSRTIEFVINSPQFSQPLIAFTSLLVTDNGQGCTLAAPGARSFGTLAVFALIPGLVLLRIFRRRMSRKD